MSVFTTSGKRYREGTTFDAFGGADLNPVSAGNTWEQTAPRELPDGAGPARKFLFWDTGRRVTGYRTVRWHFNHPENWSTWNAAAWYGTPGIGNGDPTEYFDAFWVANGTLDPTPIDGAGSSFVNGPGGESAWPWQGNDHEVHTEWGAATVHALDHLQRSVTDPLLNFSSLTRVEYGGDDSDVFDETDDDITTPGSGVCGEESTTSQSVVLPQGTGGIVLAGYVQPVRSRIPFNWSDFVAAVTHVNPWDLVSDPSPDDPIRRAVLDRLRQTVGQGAQGDPFAGLVTLAGSLDSATLKRVIVEVQSLQRQAEAAAESLKAVAERKG